MSDDISNHIGKNKYHYLKGIREDLLNSNQKKLIDIFETKHKTSLSEQQILENKEYMRKVRLGKSEVKVIEKPKINAEELWKLFINNYKNIIKRDYLLDEETTENLKTLVFYFSEDERFFNQPNLIKSISYKGEVIKESEPSFDKGCCLIGGYGSSKTSTMTIFEYTFKNVYGYRFKTEYSEELVTEFEGLSANTEKEAFWKRINNGVKFFDDVKSEPLANNFGSKNILEKCFKTRNFNDKKTHMSMNYKKGFSGDITQSLLEYGEKYGGRTFDRLFSDCNIIEFKGKSKRK